MPRSMSFSHVCCPTAMIYATPDVVRPSVMSKGGDGMSRLTSFDRVCCPKAVMSCPAQRRLTVRVVQG